ncbi:MAG: glycosyltransferase family 39 protein [Chloroflexi bacterium]|nr:glycosyltransferase family 39 protein [Chloroflexota bacterium]
MRFGLPSTHAEVVGLTALVVVAALARLPYLWSIPLFTDETADSLRSFAIYEGRQLPLTNVAHYVGAFHNYLEAAGFWVFGPSIYTPRLLVWLLGALTVAATYLLAREMLGRPAAWLAAGLLATSGVHVGGNSHVAWSQCAAPLWLALTCALLHRAVHTGSGRSLLGAGFAGGLALQSHPTVFAFLLGAGVYLFWCGRALMRTRWPYLAAGLFLLAYSNMVWFNLTTGFESIRSARSRDAAYGEDRDRDVGSYLVSQGRILTTLPRLPAGAVDARPDGEGSDAARPYLTDPLVLAYAGLTLFGVVLLARGGNPLPGLVIVSALLLFPLFGARHDILPRQGRYLAPLLPLLFTALAAGAWSFSRGVGSWLARRGVSPTALGGLGLVAAGLLVLLPLVPLQRYYAQSVADGQTNDRFFALLAEIEANRPNGEFVVLDFQLAQESLGGGGTPLRTLHYMLTLRGIPHTDLTLEPERVARRYGNGGVVVVLAEKTYRSVGAQLALEPPPGRGSLAPPSPYGVYRLGPARVGGTGG